LVSSGARKDGYNGPVDNPKNPGFYYFDGIQWIYPSYFKSGTIKFNVLDAIFDQTNNTDVFFTNYNVDAGHGIYKLKYNSTAKDFDFTKYYDLDEPTIWNRRPVGFSYDDQNNLVAAVAFSDGNIPAWPFMIGEPIIFIKNNNSHKQWNATTFILPRSFLGSIATIE
jgi:hypothetical protein